MLIGRCGAARVAQLLVGGEGNARRGRRTARGIARAARGRRDVVERGGGAEIAEMRSAVVVRERERGAEAKAEARCGGGARGAEGIAMRGEAQCGGARGSALCGGRGEAVARSAESGGAAELIGVRAAAEEAELVLERADAPRVRGELGALRSGGARGERQRGD